MPFDPVLDLLVIVLAIAAGPTCFWMLVHRDRIAIRKMLAACGSLASELKLVSIWNDGEKVRTYRAVITLPNGGRLLHRFVSRGLGPPEKIL